MSDHPETAADADASADEVTTDPRPELFGCPLSDACGQAVLHVPHGRYIEVVKALVDDGYAMCADLTAVDYLNYMTRPLPDGVLPERFEVVVNLLDFAQRRRIRVRVQVPGDAPQIESLFDIYPGTEAMEREVYDMFGISFDNHPDLTRILMPEDWIGYPLRKDYDTGRIPVQFKGAHS